MSENIKRSNTNSVIAAFDLELQVDVNIKVNSQLQYESDKCGKSCIVSLENRALDLLFAFNACLNFNFKVKMVSQLLKMLKGQR